MPDRKIVWFHHLVKAGSIWVLKQEHIMVYRKKYLELENL